jgi:hypothetical protein
MSAANLREDVQEDILDGVSSTGSGPVEDLLCDWQQTARVLADLELTAGLTAHIETPEHPASV